MSGYRASAAFLSFFFISFLPTHSWVFADDVIRAPIRSIELTPSELLQNDKEEGTVVLDEEDLDDSRRVLGKSELVSASLKKVAEKIAPLIFASESTPCETLILDRLYVYAQEEDLIQKRSHLSAVLAGLRARNLIDDLILLPLWKAVPAYAREGAFHEATCPTGALFSLRKKLKEEQHKKYHRTKLWSQVKTSYQKGEINEATYAWLGALMVSGYDRVPFTLGMVAPKIRDVKNKSSLNTALGTTSSFASSVRKKDHGWSQRIHLYEKYPANQILMIGDMFYRFSHNLTATRAELVRTFQEGDQTYSTHLKLDAQEEYDAAVGELHKEFISDARKGDAFDGKVIDFDEVTMATLEAGILPGKDFNIILRVREMWDPQIPQWKKVLKVVVTYGGPALIFVPPPYNIISSMVMILLQSTVLKPRATPHAHDVGTELF